MDYEAIERSEGELYEQGERGGGNRTLQDRRMIVQVKPADDRLSESAGADERRERC